MLAPVQREALSRSDSQGVILEAGGSITLVDKPMGVEPGAVRDALARLHAAEEGGVQGAPGDAAGEGPACDDDTIAVVQTDEQPVDASLEAIAAQHTPKPGPDDPAPSQTEASGSALHAAPSTLAASASAEDPMSLVKSAPRKKCPECATFNPTAQQTCKNCKHRFATKTKSKAAGHGDLSKGGDVDGRQASGLPTMAAPGTPQDASQLVKNLVAMCGQDGKLTVPPGLLTSLGAESPWDMGDGKGLVAGFGYTAADADLLTRMVPKTPPRKKCTGCGELNPTARQTCMSCGLKFQMKPKRAAASRDDGATSAAAKPKAAEPAPAADSAPAVAKLKAPRKKCPQCTALNPTAQQACQACGARFTIKSKLKKQQQQEASKQAALPAGPLPGLGLPFPPLSIAPGSLLPVGALAGLGVNSAEFRDAILKSHKGAGLQLAPARSDSLSQSLGVGPHGGLPRGLEADTPFSGAMDLQGILSASAALSASGAPMFDVQPQMLGAVELDRVAEGVGPPLHHSQLPAANMPHIVEDPSLVEETAPLELDDGTEEPL